MSTKTAGGVVVTALVALAIVAIGSSVMERDATDTDLPPDPFESNEPRVIDCVARWNTDEGAKANYYCAVEAVPGDESSIEDYHDEDGIERSPFTWSTTAGTGYNVYLDLEVQRRWVNMDGACEVWVDGDTLLDSAELVEDPEGVWFCRVEVVIP